MHVKMSSFNLKSLNSIQLFEEKTLIQIYNITYTNILFSKAII